MRKLCFLLMCLQFAISQQVNAQAQMLNLANEYLVKKDFPKAAELFSQVYDNMPNDKRVIDGYCNALMGIKDYKRAEKILKSANKTDKNNFNYTLMLAQIYNETGETKKANKTLKELIETNANSESGARELSIVLENKGMSNYAIELLEKAKENSKNPYLFAEELSSLYNKKGDFNRAIESMLDLAALQPLRIDNVKNNLPRLITDAGKKDTLRQKLISRITQKPDDLVYPDLLAWYYIQEGDWESAFVQEKSLDFRLAQEGRRVLNFARTATKENEFNAALLAYDYILEKGKSGANYLTALTDKIAMLKQRLELNPKYTKEDVQALAQAYEQYFNDYPNLKNTEARRSHAALLARYTDDIKGAIDILKNMVSLPGMQSVLKGNAKLDLGDYELIAGNNWQATLLYSQVDKDFKNDMLGEEARFRNAKLSYYIGDFTWAQGQLDVLKASTSELIANDALNLSVLITENMPMDSNMAPLEMFSRADLLIFRNKFKEANITLDSISKVYTDNPLLDDILMARASIAQKQQNYELALGYLKQVYEQHKEDILADDALYQAAVINEKYMDNKKEAQYLYEKIILDYPGSTLIGESRKAFRRLRGDAEFN
jgi:predicted Zn-dependent protease